MKDAKNALKYFLNISQPKGSSVMAKKTGGASPGGKTTQTNKKAETNSSQPKPQPKPETKPKSKKKGHKTVQLDSIKVEVDFRCLVAIPQMRTIFPREVLLELADSISTEGIIVPQSIAKFTTTEFEGYYDAVCAMYERTLPAEEKTALFSVTYKEHHYVVIAGEKRLRACHILWDEGCSACREANNGEPVTDGKCWNKHFNNSAIISVNVPKTKDFTRLMGIQIGENIHSRPSAPEEALAIARYTMTLQKNHAGISKKKIAQYIHRSSEAIDKAMSFYRLPASIQNLVGDKTIKYGTAIALARLHDEAHYTEEELLSESIKSVVQKDLRKVEVFDRHVEGLILAYRQKQNSNVVILDMFEASGSQPLETMLKEVATKELVKTVFSLTTYWQKVARALENPHNKMLLKGRKFTVGGVIADFNQVIEMLALVLPYVEGEVTVAQAQTMRNNLEVIHSIQKKKKAAVALKNVLKAS